MRFMRAEWWQRPLIPASPGPLADSPRFSRITALFVASQILALVVAAYCGWHGYRLVYDDRLALDRALLWDAGALLLVAYFAWNGGVPRIRAFPASVAAYVRAHPVELLVLGAVVGIAAYMRLFQYGTLPPTGYIYLEEHINGGIAWSILHGDRPYAYPLVRYSTALGIDLFGPSTLGLRAPLIVTGIAVIIPFYLLMREVAGRQAALFATAVYASLRSLTDLSAYFQVPTIAVVLMAWMMLRGLRTRNVIWLVPAAALAAVVSYEYESFKAVPLFAGGFLVFAALRAVVWPVPESLAGALTRIRGLAPYALKATVAITVTILVCIGPMMAQKHRGQNIYFSSLDRQRADRDERGDPGLFAPNARDQLKWAAQAFTPWVDPDYTALGPEARHGMIDRITSLLLWAGLGAAILGFWRGSRLFFAAWFGGGLLISGLLLSNFAPWKVNGFTPAAIVLIGLLADDVARYWQRYAERFGRLALAALPIVLALIAGSVLALNIRALRIRADDEALLKEYGNTPSQIYSVCDNLRHRPSDNFALVSQRAIFGWGFSRSEGDVKDPAAIWGDYRFVCSGLQGRAVPNLQEAWPYYIDAGRPATLIMAGRDDEIAQARDAITRALPEVGPPSTLKTAPGNLFQTLAFNATGEELSARQGLVLRRFTASGEETGETTVARSPEFDLPASTNATYTLSGLVYLPEAATAAVAPVAGSAAPIRISVDGATSFDSTVSPPAQAFAPLIAGWHLVEARGTAADTTQLRFAWTLASGATMSLDATHYFALADTRVWTHTRTYLLPDAADSLEAMRFDFYPYLAALEGLKIDATHVLPAGTRVLEDRWSARWTVDDDATYRIFFTSPYAPATILVDGNPVLTDSSGFNNTVDVPLTRGDHSVDISAGGGDTAVGILISVIDVQTNQLADIEVHPF